ncbi:DNA adenine methylase [uncultured Sneathia sp.]|uniref:DNA adenine methylase n=1 Tax=uncultured Sneathia sp. TaxID=278067 RepID=UPI0028053C6A|nr:DNA adenine methylase [uncultured Sneathia sp.]
MIVKPFIKWAGGKNQLLNELAKKLPFENYNNITKYAEPFVGGAVLFYILNNYNIKEVYISDINSKLIVTYKMIKKNVDELIIKLEKIQEKYLRLDENSRKIYYLEKRKEFNLSNLNDIDIATLFIFLNKTCFNGLYRVNKKGEFNVPMGKYKKPLICDKENLKQVSNKLKNVKIICGDYKKSIKFIDSDTFVYFDPPYRPINITSSFTAYTKDSFTDDEQIELAKYIDKLTKKGAKIMLSNSDPKNVNKNDVFFDELYNKYNIFRVKAKRTINSNASSRGEIYELVIINY